MRKFMDKHLVDICIITYQRPLLLKRLLESIFETDQLANDQTNLIVVDNDQASTAKLIVKEVKDKYAFPIQYFIEPNKSYTAARNKCIEVSEAQYIAFIDDDEWVTGPWLKQMLECMEQYSATAVFGPVLAALPDTAPQWIKQGRFFEDRERPSDGELVKYGHSGNSLINKALVSDSEFRFKAAFGQAGGEDHELFTRLYESGHKLVWADQAVVYEEVIAEKLNLSWILKRAYRNGDTFAKVYVTNKRWYQVFPWYTKKFIHLIVSGLLTPVLFLKGKGHALRMLSRTVSNYSSIMTLFKPRKIN